MSNEDVYKVWWINQGYYSLRHFKTADEALEYGKSKGFEFSIHLKDYGTVGSWSPIGGLRAYWNVFSY